MQKKLILILCLISATICLPTNNETDEIDTLENDLDQKFVDAYSVGRATNLQDLEKYGFDLNQYDARIIEDAFLTTPQLLRKYGYPVEVHKVQTGDGYILEMHRIPKPGAIPIYLQHGLIDSSAGWVIMGPQTAFAYQLSDLGYDVWMGNVRGNRYSRDHIYLDANHRDFWDFSFHEIGMEDLPAMIDFIIAKTGYKKIHYVGHSQGTTSFFIMCSQRPEYCDKIASMHALAPIAYMKHVRSPVVRAIIPFLNQIELIMKLIGFNEFLPNKDFMTMAGQVLCKEQAVTQSLCENVAFIFAGYDSEQLNETMLPAIAGHYPAGASIKQFIHYAQLVKSGGFNMYDYGMAQNLMKYGSVRPPSYDLSKVTAPIALLYSLNDWLAHIKDVRKLEDQLPNLIKQYLVPMPKFNHMDFLIAINSRSLVYDVVVRTIEEVEKDDEDTNKQKLLTNVQEAKQKRKYKNYEKQKRKYRKNLRTSRKRKTFG